MYEWKSQALSVREGYWMGLGSQLQHTCSYLTWRDPVIGQSAQGTEGKIAAGTDSHGTARLLHHRELTAWTGAVHHICH